jgi:iron complex outermembrane recepter protein
MKKYLENAHFGKKLVLAGAIQAVFAPLTMAQSGVLEEVIVSAQKREQLLTEVPISVEVFGSEELNRASITNAKELFQHSPSITFSESFSASASSMAIRGVSSLAIEGGLQSSVVMIVDDVSYARFGEFLLDLADVERVEVLRGPQGTLFGKNSTAGALNITTKRPSEEFALNLEATVTDETEQFYKASVTGPITDSIRYRVNGFYREMDDFIDNINTAGAAPPSPFSAQNAPSAINGYESQGVRGQLEIDFSDSVNLRLAADWRDFDGAGGQLQVITPRTADTARHISEIGYEPRYGQDFIDIDSEGFVVTEAWGASADLRWEINENYAFRSITSYREFEENSETDVDSTPFGTTSPGTETFLHHFVVGEKNRPTYREFDYVNQEFRLEMNFDAATAVVGMFYNDFSEETTVSTPFAIPAFGIINASGFIDGGDDNTTWAIFGDTTIDLSDNWSVFGGLRYTDEELDYSITNTEVFAPLGATYEESLANYTAARDAAFIDPAIQYSGSVAEDEVTGRIGVTYNFSDNRSAYLSYSTGYKGPGVNLSRTATDPDNTTLDPETAEAIEVGFKGSFLDNRLYLGAALFSQEIDDLQLSQLIPGTINSQLVNAGTLESKGVEVEFNAALTEGLSVNGGFVYLDAETKDLVNTCYPGQVYATGCQSGVDTEIPDSSSPSGFMKSARDLDGEQAPMSPEFSFRLGVNYDWVLSGMPFDVYARYDFSWRDSYTTRLGADPLVQIDSLALSNITVGLLDKEDHWEVALFGRNIGDEFHYGGIIENDGLIGRAVGYTTREAYAYWGIRARYSFY